jgi:hypothetical protein
MKRTLALLAACPLCATAARADDANVPPALTLTNAE